MKRTRINPISKKRSKELRHRKKLWPNIIVRDGGNCVLCGRGGCSVHEVIQRGASGHKTMLTQCFVEKNMCVLCLACHAKAHNPKTKARILQTLHARHGYDYSEEPWSRYFDEVHTGEEC